MGRIGSRKHPAAKAERPQSIMTHKHYLFSRREDHPRPIATQWDGPSNPTRTSRCTRTSLASSRAAECRALPVDLLETFLAEATRREVELSPITWMWTSVTSRCMAVVWRRSWPRIFGAVGRLIPPVSVT
jgi:hypothetical protein